MAIIRMSTKGQIVIPAELRKKLGLKAGTYLRVEENGGDLVLKHLGEDPVAAAHGAFAHLGPMTPGLLRDREEERRLEERKADRWTTKSAQ